MIRIFPLRSAAAVKFFSQGTEITGAGSHRPPGQVPQVNRQRMIRARDPSPGATSFMLYFLQAAGDADNVLGLTLLEWDILDLTDDIYEETAAF